MSSTTKPVSSSLPLSLSLSSPLTHQEEQIRSEQTPLLVVVGVGHSNISLNNDRTTGGTTILSSGNGSDSKDGEYNHPSSSSTVSYSTLQYARYMLYTSHFVAQFSETAWEFAIVLFLASLSNYQSLLFVSTYGLCTNGAVCCFGSIAGRFVDTSPNRLYTARVFIWTENISVIIASTLCYLLLISKQQLEQEESTITTTASSSTATIYTDLYSILLLIGIHIMGPVAEILDGGFSVAIERDWVVVLGQVAKRLDEEENNNVTKEEPPPQEKKQEDNNETTILLVSNDSNDYQSTPQQPNNDEVVVTTKTKTKTKNKWLTETNVIMKQIDLSCKVLSPAIAGFFIDIFGSDHLPIAAIVISLLNVVSLIVEYVCTAQIYHMIPELAHDKDITTKKQTKQTKKHQPQQDEEEDEQDEEGDYPTISVVEQPTRRRSITIQCYETFQTQLHRFFGPYFQQPLWYAGLGAALLFFNALSFGGLMMNYLLYRGMSMGSVGIWRGISSLTGLIGTFSYQFSAQHLTLVTTGMWSILSQFVCISVSMMAMFINDYTISMALLIVGVCISRIGLNVFKITVTQLMQLYIPEPIRGIIGGTQNSLKGFFRLASYAICLIYTNPHDFIIVVAAGYAAVAIAAFLYTMGIYNKSQYYT